MVLINSFIASIRWLISFLGGYDHDESISYSIPFSQSPVTSELVLRLSAHNRPYAFMHQFAFQASSIDHVRAWIFKSRINSGIDADYHKTLWMHARAWWQDLYGDTVDDLDDDQDRPRLENVYRWYASEIIPLSQLDKPHQTDQAVCFIMLWWRKIIQDSSDFILNEHHIALRRALICAHPDKGGCHHSIQLLLQWRNYVPILIDGHRHQQRLPITGQFLNLTNKAKPWHVLRLFIDHMTQVEIQKHRNFYLDHEQCILTIQNNEGIIGAQLEKIKNLRCKIGGMEMSSRVMSAIEK